METAESIKMLKNQVVFNDFQGSGASSRKEKMIKNRLKNKDENRLASEIDFSLIFD